MGWGVGWGQVQKMNAVPFLPYFPKNLYKDFLLIAHLTELTCETFLAQYLLFFVKE